MPVATRSGIRDIAAVTHNAQSSAQEAAASHPEEEEEGDHAALWMVHYMDLHPNSLHMSPADPLYRCARFLKFQLGAHPAYALGGPVMRIITDYDPEMRTPREVEDVMVCDRDFCELCFPTDWEEELKGESKTLGLPFVHLGDCKDGDGMLTFAPRDGRECGDVLECGLEERKVTYTCGMQTTSVESAVCVAATCIQCSGKIVLDQREDENTTGKRGGPPEGNKDEDDMDIDIPGSGQPSRNMRYS